MSFSSIPRELRKLVAERDGGHCRYCHLVQVGQASVFHIDHVHPRSRGGATALDNLVLQCPNCSLHKANKVAAIDAATGDEVSLFHPLRQRWSEHFALDAEGTCSGLTPEGRATAEALKMNDLLPRIARSMQIRLGLLEQKTPG